MAHIEPEAPLLDKDTISALLRECCTVVRPGEVLAVRIDPDDGFTPEQMRQIAEVLTLVSGDLGVGAMLVLGHEMAVAQPVPVPLPPAESDEVFVGRVAKALGSRQVRAAVNRETLRQGARPSRG